MIHILGEISLNPAILDYETNSQYNLTITVSDPSGLTATKMITIDILDVNEDPVIQNLPDTRTIAEDVVGKIPVFTVATADQDDDSILYTMFDTHFEITSAGKCDNKYYILYVMRAGALG